MTTTIAAPQETGLAGAGAGQADQGWTARLRRAWAEHRAYRSTLAELEALTDRELRDLGLSRWDLRSVAREAVYGK